MNDFFLGLNFHPSQSPNWSWPSVCHALHLRKRCWPRSSTVIKASH